MGRVATTIDEQIKLLKDRGMVFDHLNYPIEKVKSILLDIGYYRLGFYWRYFEIDDEHNFKKGTRFSDVIDLYYLDVDLRSILMRYTNRIEINFRTKLIYEASNKYRNIPTWFAKHNLVMNSFITKLENVYYTDDFKSKNFPIYKHHQKYINDIYAPAWKTLEFFTFGAIIHLYESIKDDELRKNISLHYGIRNVKAFTNYLKMIQFIRNMSAHGRLLYDVNTSVKIYKTPLIKIPEENRQTLDGIIRVVSYFLGVISPNRQDDLETEVKNKFLKYKDNQAIRKIIEEKIKFSF